MEEIKVGEYVRTNRGISKVVPDGRYVEINEDENKRMMYVDKNGIPCNWEFSYYIWSNEITKHSPNIIDLIEVGDYVSSEDDIEGKVNFVMLPLKIFVDGEEVLNDEIKSIVTHEQLAQIEYKVEE